MTNRVNSGGCGSWCLAGVAQGRAKREGGGVGGGWLLLVLGLYNEL